MRIKMTHDIDIEDRLAIGLQMGQSKPASYEDCKQYLYDQGALGVAELVIHWGDEIDFLIKENPALVRRQGK